MVKKKSILLIIGGAIIAAFFLFRKKSGVGDGKMNDYTTNGTATLKKADIERISQAQFDAMTVIGTDKKRLFSVLEPLNGDDLKLIYNAFGVKKYLGTSGTGLIASWFGYELDLFGWYTKELSSITGDLQKMRILWTSKGVKVNF